MLDNLLHLCRTGRDGCPGWHETKKVVMAELCLSSNNNYQTDCNFIIAKLCRPLSGPVAVFHCQGSQPGYHSGFPC